MSLLGALLILVLVFLIVTLFGYVSHWSLHQSWTGRFNNAHMTHHLTLYPPSDYISDKYRGAGKDNTFFTFALISLPLLGLPFLLFFLGAFSLPLTIIVLAEMLLIGYLHDYIHTAFHVSNHWLNKFKMVKELGQIHFVHHVDMSKNLGIYSFFWDKIFGTYQDKL